MSVFNTAADLYNKILELIKVNGTPAKNKGVDLREAYKHLIDTLFAVKQSLDEVVIDLEGKQDELVFDEVPTNGSPNLVNSSNIKAALTALKAELINGAPEALDTFLEISAALQEDDNAFSALNTAISLRILTSSIVDALTSFATDQPLSANQGRVLKGLCDTLSGNIGVLANLNTTAKGNLVAAVNELQTSISTLAGNIGTLANLKTTAKGNLVAAINEVRDQVKKDIALYNPAEVVSAGQYREYGGLFWRYISETPAAGVTPIEGASWTQVDQDTAAAPLAQTTGTSTTQAMSQKATTDGYANALTAFKAAAQTFLQKITFTLAPRFSSATASKVLKVDANKDLISGSVDNADLTAMPALSVKVNATNASAVPTDLQATVAERVFVRNNSNVFAFIQLTANYIADLAISTIKIADLAITTAKLALKSVGNSQLADMPAYTVKSNLAGTLGPPGDYPGVDFAHDATGFVGFFQDENPDVFNRCPWTNISDISIASINGTTARISLLGASGNGWGSKVRKAYTMYVGQEITVETMGLHTFPDNTSTFELRGLLNGVSVASTGAVAGTSGAAIANKVFHSRIVYTVRTLKAGATLGTMDVQGFLQLDGKYISLANSGLIDFDNTIDNTFDADGQFTALDATHLIKCTKSKILIAG